MPTVEGLELHFYRRFNSLCGGKCLPHSVDSGGGVSFPWGGSPLEERGNLVQLLAEFLLCRHWHCRLQIGALILKTLTDT
jgi:hypothetical protein